MSQRPSATSAAVQGAGALPVGRGAAGAEAGLDPSAGSACGTAVGSGAGVEVDGGGGGGGAAFGSAAALAGGPDIGTDAVPGVGVVSGC